MLVTSGLAHLPPIKVVTILSGVMHVNLLLFIVSAIVARGARFCLPRLAAATLWRADPPLHREAPRPDRDGGAAVLILLYIILHYMF